ncbi:MAG TPA: GAF and ANTAR domain-containing protein [Acidimicrobiales bacterium]|nr:GAF and ANTAR domain-containing protein [Acidimicrobiales bacterium]
MNTPADIGAAIAAAARDINQEHSLDETLHAIVRAARNSVPGFDQVGISTFDRHGNIATNASTGELVETLDSIQYTLGQGPCVDTLREADVQVVTAPHIRHDQRWPRYVRAAVDAGLRSQLAVKLYLDDEGTLGSLNFYSTTADDIEPDADHIADLFAAHAAIALEHARERDTLNQALQSRKVIGQALGIVMERYEMNEDRAFQFLVRASSTSNTKLRDIAQELVDQRNKE